MSKKHISLDFFPQESTVALPTFEQSPVVTLRTSDRLVCKFKYRFECAYNNKTIRNIIDTNIEIG